MIFEWDEAKNRINRKKHGPDFDAVFTFDRENALVADRTRHGDGEPQFARIISLRRSHRKEERAYESAKEKSDTGS